MYINDSGEGFCLYKISLWRPSLSFIHLMEKVSSLTAFSESLNVTVEISICSDGRNHNSIFTVLRHQDQTRSKKSQWHCYHYLHGLIYIQETGSPVVTFTILSYLVFPDLSLFNSSFVFETASRIVSSTIILWAPSQM